MLCATSSSATSTPTCRPWTRCSLTRPRSGTTPSVCLGDLVGYGARPGGRHRACARARTGSAHPWEPRQGLRRPRAADAFNDAARRAAEWTRRDPDAGGPCGLGRVAPRTTCRCCRTSRSVTARRSTRTTTCSTTADAARAMAAASARSASLATRICPPCSPRPDEPVTASADEPDELRLPKTGPGLDQRGIGWATARRRPAGGLRDPGHVAAGRVRLRRVPYDVARRPDDGFSDADSRSGSRRG